MPVAIQLRTGLSACLTCHFSLPLSSYLFPSSCLPCHMLMQLMMHSIFNVFISAIGELSKPSSFDIK